MKYLEVREFDEYSKIDENGQWEESPFPNETIIEHKFTNLLEFKKYIEKTYTFSVEDLQSINGNDLQICYDEKNVGILKSFFLHWVERTEFDTSNINWDEIK